jgi:1,2-diacylglycerol 3-beta-galactosyltransferase
MRRDPERVRAGRKITFLCAETGGGHRSAATSIIDALDAYHGDKDFDISVVDIFKDYAPRPLNRVDRIYAQAAKTPAAWGLSYRWTDSRRRAQFLHKAFWPYVRRSMYQLLRENESDLLVSVHFASNALLRALGPRRPAYMTVVTDLVTTHALWYDRRVDQCLVPTETARMRALECGLSPGQVHTTGLPVSASFTDVPGDWLALRQQFGWPVERPVVLLIGGGDGVGPVYALARAISDTGLPLTLAVVAGRNARLQKRLEARDWAVPTHIYGFVQNMPQMMAASDVLLSKAGPGTISEAFQMGLPVILYHCLPGQEEGNVQHVVEGGAGVWAPRPHLAVEALARLIHDSDARRRMSAASAALARPQAAHEVADRVAALALRGPALRITGGRVPGIETPGY